MENVSEKWKALHNELLLPEQFIEVVYSVSEKGVNDTYQIEVTPQAPWADVSNMSEAGDVPMYATLEQNFWVLDGSRTIMPNEGGYGKSQFVSNELSNENGYYIQNPQIILKWPELKTGLIPGITIQWTETFSEYPVKYKVSVYNDENLLLEHIEENNDSAFSSIYADIQNYNKIVLEVIQWNLPYHRARIEQLYVGIIHTYDKDDLMSYNHEDFVDILSGELPKNSIVFALDNSTGKWNPLNPIGDAKFLMEEQTIQVKYGMKVADETEWISGGVFYLSEWNTPSNGIEATFTARDVLGFLNEKYEGIRAGSLYDIALAAITQIKLPDEATYYFSPELMNINVDFTSDTTDYTIAEVLQMVANSGRCIMLQDRTGCLRIERAGDVLSDYVINNMRSLSWPEITLSKELKAVDVNNGMVVVENGAKGAIQTVDNPLVTSEEVAREVGEWTKNILKNRTTISGEYRPDTRMSASDIISVESKFSETSSKVFVTSIKYSFTGGFKGTFEGRIVE